MENDKPTQPTPATPVPDEIPDHEMPPAPVLDDKAVPQPPKLKKSPKGLIVVLIIIMVLAAAGIAGWLLFGKPDQQTPATPTADQPKASTTSTDDVPEAQNTETFTSSPYRITLQYPKTWTVTENNDNSLLIQSQSFTYKTASGDSQQGNFRVYVRKGAQQADSDIIAKGVAMQDSQKLTYTKPTPAQRAETNLSLFGLDSEDNFAFLLITGNFSLKKGDTLGPNFGKEIETIVIGGGYSQPGAEPGMATTSVPPTGFDQTNAYKQAISIIQSLEIM